MTTKQDNSSYEKHRSDLIRKLRQLPEWRQRIFFAQAAKMGLVTITEKDLKPKLKLVK